MSNQEMQIRRLIEHAEKDQNRGGRLRHDAFMKLIEIAHSSDPHLKCYAAHHIPYFFNDFPSLEEDAINAVYDLCEDQDSQVRIEGYRTISSVSSVQHKWIKRNADVLVQLLQSDEPEEVATVKAALGNHLDMDPGVTLGVLCDQIIPLDNPVDEEEQQIRDNLRSLVITFLKDDAIKAIIRKHTKTSNTQAENVLVDQLLTAIRRLETHDVELIIKDLLLTMPCYRPGSARGMDLLHVLIDKARSSLNAKSNDLGPIKTIDFYISLAHLVAIERRVASPVVLLRFYCTSLLGKPVLQRFSPEEQIRHVGRVVEALEACEDESRVRPQVCSPEQFSLLRRLVIDGAPNLLEALDHPKLESHSAQTILHTLLLTCKHRKEQENWTVPFQLTTSISGIQARVQQWGDNDAIQALIRSLTEPAMSQASTTSTIDGNNPPERSAHLPDRPQLGRPPLKRPDMTQPLHADTMSSSRPALQTRDTESASSKRSLSFGEATHIKRAKTELIEERQLTPSLLSRIMKPIAGDTERTARRRGPAGKKLMLDDPSEPDKHPMGGYSIKGAAAHAEQGEVLGDPGPRPSSLLDRLNRSEGADSGNHRKRRGKA